MSLRLDQGSQKVTVVAEIIEAGAGGGREHSGYRMRCGNCRTEQELPAFSDPSTRFGCGVCGESMVLWDALLAQLKGEPPVAAVPFKVETLTSERLLALPPGRPSEPPSTWLPDTPEPVKPEPETRALEPQVRGNSGSRKSRPDMGKAVLLIWVIGVVGALYFVSSLIFNTWSLFNR